MKKLHTILACICTAAILPLLVAVMVGGCKKDSKEIEHNPLLGVWDFEYVVFGDKQLHHDSIILNVNEERDTIYIPYNKYIEFDECTVLIIEECYDYSTDTNDFIVSEINTIKSEYFVIKDTIKTVIDYGNFYGICNHSYPFNIDKNILSVAFYQYGSFPTPMFDLTVFGNRAYYRKRIY